MDYLFLDSCYVPNIFALIQFYEFGELVNFGWLLICLLPEQNIVVDKWSFKYWLITKCQNWNINNSLFHKVLQKWKKSITEHVESQHMCLPTREPLSTFTINMIEWDEMVCIFTPI